MDKRLAFRSFIHPKSTRHPPIERARAVCLHEMGSIQSRLRLRALETQLRRSDHAKLASREKFLSNSHPCLSEHGMDLGKSKTSFSATGSALMSDEPGPVQELTA